MWLQRTVSMPTQMYRHTEQVMILQSLNKCQCKQVTLLSSHNLLQCYRVTYCIVENFEGENLHKFRGLRAIRESYLHEIWARPHPPIHDLI
jgi:hypothetical protein